MHLLFNMFVWIFMVGSTAIFSTLAIIYSWFDPSGRLTHFYSAHPWGRSILWIGRVKVKIRGLENVQKNVPYILMPNHQSFFDIFGLLAYLPLDFKFILKKELLSIPLLGYSMRRAGYVPIDRSDPRKALKSMADAAERIKLGATILIFPEGTRSEQGVLQEFKKGGFHLALKAGCAIVPIGIVDSHKIMPKGRALIRSGTFAISIGKPISTLDYQKKNMNELMDRVHAAIAGLMQEATAMLAAPENLTPDSSE